MLSLELCLSPPPESNPSERFYDIEMSGDITSHTVTMATAYKTSTYHCRFKLHHTEKRFAQNFDLCCTTTNVTFTYLEKNNPTMMLVAGVHHTLSPLWCKQVLCSSRSISLPWHNDWWQIGERIWNANKVTFSSSEYRINSSVNYWMKTSWQGWHLLCWMVDSFHFNLLMNAFNNVF